MFVNETEICKFKVNGNTSWYNFRLGSKSKDEQNKIPLNVTVYNFSVDHHSIKIEDILNIHKFHLNIVRVY